MSKTSESRPGPRRRGAKAIAAAALAAGQSVRDAAAAAGVHRATLWRWGESDATFAEALERAEDRVAEKALGAVDQALAELQAAGLPAVRVMVKSLADEDLALALRAADHVTKRIPELSPRQSLDVDLGGSLEARLAELDASGDPGTPD